MRRSALALVFAWATVAALFFLADGIYHEDGTTALGQKLPEVDVIVCLAGGKGRIEEGSSVWHEYYKGGFRPLPTLYLSGVGAKTSWNALKVLLNPLVVKVIEPSQVVLENESPNTVGNAEWFARTAREKGWKRVLLVTSKYHLRRSRLIFDHVLNRELRGNVELHTLSVVIEPFEAKRWWFTWQGVEVTLLEYVKYLYYRLVL